MGSRNGPSAIGPQLFGLPSVESNIAAKFSSAAAKINCGYNILAAKYFAAALQRKKLTFLTIPIYIYIYIYMCVCVHCSVCVLIKNDCNVFTVESLRER